MAIGEVRRDSDGKVTQLGATTWPAPNDALAALLGVQRSAIVRLLDGAPATCGLIARALLLAPGGVTHHLRSLEAAGLIRRTREGRHVLVELTARGRGLQTLYELTTKSGYGPRSWSESPASAASSFAPGIPRP